jgi:hypothetical protein
MSVQAQDVIDQFQTLTQLCRELSARIAALEDDAWQAWVIPGDSHAWGGAESPHQLTADVYQCLQYVLAGGSGRETWQVPGLLAIPEYILPLARQVNAQKTAFHQTATAYRKLFADTQGRQKLRDLLSQGGIGRVHIKHCSRQIIIGEEPLKAISLSWVKAKRSIKKISAHECEDRLWKLEASGKKGGIDAQLNLLHSLSVSDQERLRLVQDQTNPTVKGLAYLADGTKQHLGYFSMPALIYNEGSKKLPKFTRIPDEPTPGKRPRRRADARIGMTPLLSSIRVFLIDG